MKYLNTSRKTFSLRGLNLETGEYFTTIKNQTQQQNSFFTFSAPKPVIHVWTGTSGASSLIFEARVFLSTAEGTMTMYAGAEAPSSGTWVNLSVNGTVATIDPTSNPWIVSDSNIVFTAGYNTVTGTFVNSSSEVFSVLGVWANSWED